MRYLFQRGMVRHEVITRCSPFEKFNRKTMNGRVPRIEQNTTAAVGRLVHFFRQI